MTDVDFEDLVIAAGKPIDIVDRLIEWCGIDGRGFVLEAGCGTGKLGMSLASRKDCAAVLLDRDPVALDRSSRYLASVQALMRRTLPVVFRSGDILALPFHDGTFDLVFNEGVIEHFRDPRAPLREMARVSALWVAAVVPHAMNKRQADMAAFQMEAHAGTDRWEAYEKPMLQEELERHFDQVGLTRVRTSLTMPDRIPPEGADDYRMVIGAGMKEPSGVVVR